MNVAARIMPTIILIDDNQEWTLEIKTFLGEAGFSVEIAGDGSVALKLLERSNPALVILDVHLPQVSGIEILRVVREQNQNVPVLMVSADDQAGVMSQALHEGATCFLRKPVKIELLLRAIQRSLNAS